MAKSKDLLPENIVIVWNNGPLEEYRRFFSASNRQRGNNGGKQ